MNKNNLPLDKDGALDLDTWLQNLSVQGYEKDLQILKNACTFSQLSSHDYATEIGESCLHHALHMVDVLSTLHVDKDTLIAAIMFVNVHYTELSLDDVSEQFGTNVAKLVSGVCTMGATSLITRYESEAHPQTSNIRKMLLAMVDDVRVVLIKLADRLCSLRSASHIKNEIRKTIALESLNVYAPLANCLGIGSIKWEIEDLSFRYIYPEEYKSIATSLNAKRKDRERYVNLIITELKNYLHKIGLKNFQVTGRAKHIHSIHRKMLRKNVPLEQIYDATAVRILVDTADQCYEVLGCIDALWKQIPHEFDDYIAHPKNNGYQSLHTAVEGPEGRLFEVQIRTYAMHEQAERGVAAHWKYKLSDEILQNSHERKIEWLREVLAWHHDVTGNSKQHSAFIDDRVYVFTPNSRILDLPSGVTTLDFAYHVHSELGHRCRGAKVNGNIVPLTYVLKTGDVIEILTGKESKPSRDWINPHLHYLHTSRARAKVLHWFKMQDYEKNCSDGKEILDKELKALGLKNEQLNSVLPALHMKTLDDVRAAIGRGDLKVSQVLNKILPAEKIEVTAHTIIQRSLKKTRTLGDLKVEGVGRLLTNMARCCQPLPGDDIIGYITLGRGISVHKKDCSNILHATEKQRTRFVSVSWSDEIHNVYSVDLLIKAFDRNNLLRDLTAVLSADRAHVLSLKTHIDSEYNINYLTLRIELSGLEHWIKVLNHLRQISNVLEVQRINV